MKSIAVFEGFADKALHRHLSDLAKVGEVSVQHDGQLKAVNTHKLLFDRELEELSIVLADGDENPWLMAKLVEMRKIYVARVRVEQVISDTIPVEKFERTDFVK